MTNSHTLPLFPLNTVLFPNGILSLRIFEERYIKMMRDCLRAQQPFGVCLIAAGQETGEAAVPHLVGTEAHIQSCEQPEPGLFTLVVHGKRRFRIENHEVAGNGLLSATVHWLQESGLPVPAAQSELLPLLEAMINGQRQPVLKPYHFDNAAWVGARYTELLPIPLLAKQRLLELEDVISRLEIIQQFLRQHGLLGAASPPH